MPLNLLQSFSPRPFASSQRKPQPGEEPLLLHFDVNKTVIHSDSIQQKNIEEGIREGIAELFWGTVREDAEKGPVWEWCSVYSCQPPPHKTGSERMVNYAQFCKDTIEDKAARKHAVRSFRFAGAAQEDMERLHRTTLKKMELPESVRGQKDAIESGLIGLTLNMFPTLFHLVTTLQRQRRQFAVLFRSFGADHKNIMTEWNAFCEMKHPVFKSLLEGVGPLDGTKEGVPDRRIHKTHTLYRDEKGPVLILEANTNGPKDADWDRWAKAKPTKDTRNGRRFIEVSNYATVEGIPNIQKWMKKHLDAQMTSAIKDDWAWWQFNKEDPRSGKLLPVIKGITQLFFDDNIEHDISRIVDCRDSNGNPVPVEASLNKLCVKVNPVEALLDDEYFLMKLRMCTGETQIDTGSKVAKAQRQISEMEEKQRNLERQLDMMAHQLKTVTLDNQRMRMKNKVDPKDQNDLSELLQKNGIDLSAQEPDGNNKVKTVADLWGEIESGDCWLEQDASGKLVRILDMCFLRIIHKDHLLIETKQQDHNEFVTINYLPGVRIPVTTELTHDIIADKFGKMLGVNFETFMKLDSFPVAEQTAPEQATLASRAFGKALPSKVHQHIGVCSVDEAGSNSNLDDAKKMKIRTDKGRSDIQKEVFVTTDPDTGLSHFWRWEKRASWDARIAATPNRGPNRSGIEVQAVTKKLFEGSERGADYTELLQQMFELFEGQTIAGGFSGSMVIRVQPYEIDGTGNLRRGEACVVKLDDAHAIRDEVEKSNKVFEALPDRAAQVLGPPVYSRKLPDGSDPPRTYGAMRLELAGACWNVPEFQDGDSNLLCTFKDLLIFQSENQLLDGRGEDQCSFYGEVDPVIAETFGPGGIVSSLRKGGLERMGQELKQGLMRAAERSVEKVTENGVTSEVVKLGAITNTEESKGAWYTLKGKKNKYNPWTASREQYPPGEYMGKIYREHFNDPSLMVSATASGLPDLPEALIKPLADHLKRITEMNTGEDLLPLIALSHGDLNAANIMIDAQEAVWLIDFATSVDMPLFTDMTKFETCCFFEYACIPITPTVLMKLAGTQDGAWKQLNVDAWLKVNFLTARALLKELAQHELKNTLHTLDKWKLEEIIEHAVSKSEKPAEKQKAYKSALKARLTVEESVMKDAFSFCRQISDLMCQGDFLLDTLDTKMGDMPEKNGAQSLKYFLEKCLGIRKHMHTDILACLRDQKKISGLHLIDTLSLQMWMNILRETFRLPGYNDISPWHKVWGIYHCTKVAQRVKDILDQIETDRKGLKDRMMKKVDLALDGLTEATQEEVEEDPICSVAESHWFHENADWIPSTHFVKVVRQLHATDPQYVSEPGLYAPIWVVHQEAQDLPLNLTFNTSVKGSCPIYLEKVFNRENGHLELGQFIQKKGQKPRVVLKSRIMPLTSKLLAPKKNKVNHEGHRMPFKFSMEEWRSGLHDNAGTLDMAPGGVVRRSEGKNSCTHRSSLQQPEEVCQFLSLECVVPEATESGRKERVTLVIGSPVYCYPPGTFLAYLPRSEPEMPKEVVVLRLAETGGYHYRLTSKVEEESDEITPFSGNHALVRRCKYKVNDRIIFKDGGSRNVKWSDATIVTDANEKNKFLYEVEVEAGEDAVQLKTVHLSVMNSGLVDAATRLTATTFETDFRKFFASVTSKHSSFIDTMSGQRVSIKECAKPSLRESMSAKHPLRKSTQNLGAGSRQSRMHLPKTYSMPLTETGAPTDNKELWKEMISAMQNYSACQPTCQPLAFLVSGSPGSGKTCLCYRVIHEISISDKMNDLIPIMIPVSELVKRSPIHTKPIDEGGKHEKTDITDAGVRMEFDRYLRLQFGGESTKYFMVEQAIRMHRVVFIFEGLEDIANRGQISKLIKKLVRERHLVVMTSRPVRADSMLFDEPDMSDLIVQMTMQDLTEAQVRMIAHARLEGNKEAMDSFNRFLFPTDILLDSIQQDRQDEQKTVFFNPLMLSMLLCYLTKGKDTGAGTEEQGAPQEITISAVFGVAVDVILMALQSRMQADRLQRDKSMTMCKRILERMAMAMQLKTGDHHGELDLKEVDELLEIDPQSKDGPLEMEISGVDDEKNPLKAMWKQLQITITAGHAIFLRCSKDGSGKEEVLQVRFSVPYFLHYFAASHIIMDYAGMEAQLPELEDLLNDNDWKPVLEMLSEASPNAYVRVITERVRRFKSDEGKSFLHIAAQVGHRPCFRLLTRFPEELQKCLHKPYGADLWTPLHVAAHAGSKALCSLMLDANANINTEDASGRLPMHVAMQQGFLATAKFLLDRWMVTMGEGAHRQRPRKNVAQGITTRLLGLDHGAKLAEEEFLKLVNEIVELQYFNKSADDLRRITVVSLLSVFWVLNDEYDRFVEEQPANKMKPDSWKRMQEAIGVPEIRRNTNRTGALLIMMAIRPLGRIQDFMETFTPHCDTPDESLKEVLTQYPILLPSFAYLEDSMQQYILFTAGINLGCNFGQIFQLETVPATLTILKDARDALDRKGQNAEGFLPFWMMYNFFTMCGILGPKTSNGSAFMDEGKWSTFQRCNQAIKSFERQKTTALEVYDSLLKDLAKTVNIKYDNTDEVRAQIRLVAQVRAENKEQAHEVTEAFQAFEKRSKLTQFMNADGIKLTPGLVLIRLPQFLTNCKTNPNIGLVDAFYVLMNMYKVCMNEYKTTEKPVVSIALGADILEHARDCGDPEVFRFTKLEVRRAEGHKADSSGTINLSPWQWVNDSKGYYEGINELAVETLENKSREKAFRAKLMEKVTELKNLAADRDADRDKAQHDVYMTTLGALLSVFWTANGEEDAFTCLQPVNKKLSHDSWGEIQEMTNSVMDSDLLHCVFVTLIIKGLGRVPKFKQQLAPYARTPQEALDYVLENAPNTLPSYSTLGEHRKLVKDLLVCDFDFRRFLKAETVPADLTKVKDLLNTRYDFLNADGNDGRQCLLVYLFCCFAEMSGSSASNNLEGSSYMIQQRWEEFVDGKAVLEQSATCSETEVVDQYLELCAGKLDLQLRIENKESRAAVRLAIMAVQQRDWISKEACKDTAKKVKSCFEELTAEERRLLAGFLSADGIKERPAFAMHGMGDFLQAMATDRASGSKEGNFDKAKMLSAMQLLLAVYKRAAAEPILANSSLPVVDVHLDQLVASVREDRSEITFQDKPFDLKVSDGRNANKRPIGWVIPKVWTPIKRREILEHYTNLGNSLAKELLTQPTRLSEEAFRNRVTRAFPELSYFNAGSNAGNGERTLAVNGERTLGALLSIFWLVSDQHHLFIRGQIQEEQLTPESWSSIRRWMTETIKLTTEDAVDAMLVFMAIHALGKIPEFRAELAQEFNDPNLHDVALAHVLKTNSEVVPSFSRLNEKYKQLIIDSLSVDFQFSQFLKAENVAANLGVVQDKLKTHDEDSFGFFCFRIFAQMCGKSGWKPHTGSLFMTESEYRRFLPGLDTLVKLRTLDAGDAYSSFLLEKGWSSVKFASPEHQALSRLLCLGSASEHQGFGDELIQAFKSMNQEKKAKLMEWLIADGINRRPGYVLCDAPTLLENAHSNLAVGLSEALEMMVRVQSRCAALDLVRGRSSPAKVLVHLGELATWAKEAAPPLQFSQAGLEVRADFASASQPGDGVDTRVIRVEVKRPQASHADQLDGSCATVCRRWVSLGFLCMIAVLFVTCTCVSLGFMLGPKSEADSLEQRTRPFLRGTGNNGEQHRTAAIVFGGAAAVFGVLLLICSFFCCCRGCMLPGARSVGHSSNAFPLLEGCHYYEAVHTEEEDAETGSSARNGDRSARSSIS